MKRADLGVGMAVAVDQGKYVEPYKGTVVYTKPYQVLSYYRRDGKRLTFTYDGQTLEAPNNVATFGPSVAKGREARDVLVQREDGQVVSVPLTKVRPVEYIAEREAERKAKREAERAARRAREAHRDRLRDAAGRVNALLGEGTMRAPEYVSSSWQQPDLSVEALEALLDMAERVR